MSEQDDLLVSISNTIKTYRQGEIIEPTPQHVERWAQQFLPANRLSFLREFHHVIRQTFIPESAIRSFLNGLVTNPKLVVGDPVSYWSRCHILTIQKDGQSQREMVKLFGECLRRQYGINIYNCGAGDGDYIYLDDILFSGRRISTDVGSWIAERAPPSANLHIIVMANHELGSYLTSRSIRESINRSGKNIRVNYWRSLSLENRRIRKNISDVLWPVSIPAVQEVQEYAASVTKFPLDPRAPGGALRFFSSEEARQLLESEFLIAGVKIRSKTQHPKDHVRPLGFGRFGMGFGSLIVTYRNCPNNCPLALWWGDGAATSGALHWYPLLQRKTYSAPENVFNAFADFKI